MGSKRSGPLRTFAHAASLLAVIGAMVGGTSSAAPPQIPAYAPSSRAVWLDQGWSTAERDWFHHVSQGTDTVPIPYEWFMAVERPVPSLASPGLFSDAAFLDRFGFIPGKVSVDNPGRLPVGFARTKGIDPTNGKPFDQIGLTCAACHTGRLDYRGTAIYVDGGPAMTDANKFRSALAFALGLTLISPPRFLRFADRVLGPRRSLIETARLKAALAQTVKEGLKLQIAEPRGRGNVEEGYGRIDALNRIGNEVFAAQLGDKRNYAPISAPVAYPHIWNTHWFDWVQYNSSIEQPMGRNAGEAMGVRALVNYDGIAAPRYTSTIPIDKLYEIETLLAGRTPPTEQRRFTGLRAPAWPENVLPRVDRPLAAQGEALYRQHCSTCHLPAVKSDAFWASPAWLPANAAGQRYLRLPVMAVSAIGTDPAQAVDMKNRIVRVPLTLNFPDPIRKDGTAGVYNYGGALRTIVGRVVAHWYDSQTLPTTSARRDQMAGYRPDGIRDGTPASGGGTIPVYKARPLDGIWATAPYLHNGSVPTLYDLLSPYTERPRNFWLGNREFDAIKVGYMTTPIAGGFLMRTADARGVPIRGNGNGGHLFETPGNPARPRAGTIGPTLSPADRRALVEYLKTL